MLAEILRQSRLALRRNPLRSLLTMLGIVWGVVAVSVLLAYGSGFRSVLVRSFDAFGKSAVVCWPGQTGEQAAGERAGKRVRFEKADMEAVRQKADLVRLVSLETFRWLAVSYGDRLVNTTVRGVYPDYAEIRNEVPSEGRWINHEDLLERRRVVFLGGRLRQQLFAGRPAVGESVLIRGVRFTVIGTMERKLQLSNDFTSDDESCWIPYTTAGDLWHARSASVMVFAPVVPQWEEKAKAQVLGVIGRRQRFSPTDRRAVLMFVRQELRPVLDGITIGLQALLVFIGTLTLGIGGVGVMNIMLVSADERVREIGLRRALGARRAHIRAQLLAEAPALTLAGGVLGVLLACLVAAAAGTLPLLGPLFQDASGKADIRLVTPPGIAAASALILVVVGLLSGVAPALRASRLDPAAALRYG
ncbi:MAG: ABC transporter permease [Bryobacterales bacterium]|nr:ABC transporter permease [Bryobacteraceae bacterium]MDW8130972.1 ABC transporter permease [Bryobacterales bacterium]